MSKIRPLVILTMGFIIQGCMPTTDNSDPAPMESATPMAGGTQANVSMAPPVDVPPAPPTAAAEPDLDNISADKAAVAGRIVDQEGTPLGGLRVLCCSHNICYQDETGDDGRYVIADIDINDTYKMQAADPKKTYTSVYFYQVIQGGALNELERDVILQPRKMEPIPWTVMEGGTVKLADDVLELSADPGSLMYPTGLPEEIAADPIPGDILPPYKGAEWSKDAENLLAFVFNPAPIGATKPIVLKVSTASVGDPGAQWTIWSLNPDTAEMENVGIATVQDDGSLVSDEDSTLKHLNAIVLEPAPEG